MRSPTSLLAALVLAAACSDGTEPSPVLAVSSRLLAAAVDSGGTVVVRVEATNPGDRRLTAKSGSSCVATARIETPVGKVVATPTILCAPVVTTYHFAPGDTSQWDIGLDVRSPPGPYVVVASLVIGTAVRYQDTLALAVQ